MRLGFAAALRVLDAPIPQRWVIFFTHLYYLRRLAECAISPNQYFVREL